MAVADLNADFKCPRGARVLRYVEGWNSFHPGVARRIEVWNEPATCVASFRSLPIEIRPMVGNSLASWVRNDRRRDVRDGLFTESPLLTPPRESGAFAYAHRSLALVVDDAVAAGGEATPSIAVGIIACASKRTFAIHRTRPGTRAAWRAIAVTERAFSICCACLAWGQGAHQIVGQYARWFAFRRHRCRLPELRSANPTWQTGDVVGAGAARRARDALVGCRVAQARAAFEILDARLTIERNADLAHAFAAFAIRVNGTQRSKDSILLRFAASSIVTGLQPGALAGHVARDSHRQGLTTSRHAIASITRAVAS